MKKPFIKRQVITLILILTLFPLFSTDRDIALVYQVKVWEFIERDSEKTWELLETASTYYNRMSGLWFARGVLLENESRLIEAADSYENALLYDDWEGSDYEHFLERYFALLTRLCQWEKIREAREKVGFYRVNNSQVLLSSAWADFSLGEEKAAAEKASRGINLYPDNLGFYTLLIACGGKKSVIDSFIFYWGEKEESLFSAVYTLTKLNRLPGVLKEYYLGKTRDDLSLFFSLKQSLQKGDQDLDSLAAFLKGQSLYDLDLLFELYHLTNAQGKEMINRELLTFTHEYYTDRNGDFYKELVLNPDRTLLIDRNRDSYYETQLELTPRGLPQHWISDFSSDSKREITFFSWPLVKEVKRYMVHGEQIFSFLYPQFNVEEENLAAFLYHNNQLNIVGIMESLMQKDLTIPREIFLHNCNTLQEYKSGKLFRNYLLHKGEILGIEEDSQGDGQLDRQILMAGGEIQAARRDLDNNGTYDLFEYYEKGVWKGYAINLNGEDWSDFYHDWSVIPIKIWDFESDHIVNSYSLESSGGEIKIIEPQVSDIIKVDDLLYWEKKFETQWYR